ncbi:MAG TPA: hypothetical protein ENG39_00650, partial [Candidatus Omnitrophica bacterium]|nr:hypothetical protein [Candidatus Omnitrophota bacterium]
DFGISGYKLEEIIVSSREEAIDKAYQILEGKQQAGVDIVAINAGWALYILDEVRTPKQGFEKVKQLFKDKEVLKKVQRIKDYYKNATAGSDN